jgi:hypothetical protein
MPHPIPAFLVYLLGFSDEYSSAGYWVLFISKIYAFFQEMGGMASGVGK